MIEFDIKAAKEGAKVQTKDGVIVELLRFDFKLGKSGTAIMGVSNNGECDTIYFFEDDGSCLLFPSFDLVMAEK